jgi:hypothetical protein
MGTHAEDDRSSASSGVDDRRHDGSKRLACENIG